jgi:hypothetical protein
LFAFLLCQCRLIVLVARTSQLRSFVSSRISAVAKNLMPFAGGLPSGFTKRAVTNADTSWGWRKDFRADLAAPSHQKTLRRDYFRATEASFPFSEPLTANSTNRKAASVTQGWRTKANLLQESSSQACDSLARHEKSRREPWSLDLPNLSDGSQSDNKSQA